MKIIIKEKCGEVYRTITVYDSEKESGFVEKEDMGLQTEYEEFCADLESGENDESV